MYLSTIIAISVNWFFLPANTLWREFSKRFILPAEMAPNSEHFAKAFAVLNLMRKYATFLLFVNKPTIIVYLFYTGKISFVMSFFQQINKSFQLIKQCWLHAALIFMPCLVLLKKDTRTKSLSKILIRKPLAFCWITFTHQKFRSLEEIPRY